MVYGVREFTHDSTSVVSGQWWSESLRSIRELLCDKSTASLCLNVKDTPRRPQLTQALVQNNNDNNVKSITDNIGGGVHYPTALMH